MVKSLQILSLFLSLNLLSTISKAQDIFEVPKNYSFKTTEDYIKYDSLIMEAAKWLEFTDLDKESFKRKQVNQFFINWLTGTPSVKVTVNEKLSHLIGNNKELLNIYFASYARHMLENKSKASEFSATKAGLLSLIRVYKKNVEIIKNKELETIIKMKPDSELNVYIRQNLLN